MKKNTLILLIMVFICTTVSSQTKITDFENDLKSNSTNIKDVIPIVDENSGDLAIFIADAKNVYAYKFNPEFILKEKLSSETKKRKFKVLLGSSINKNDYRLFLSNKDKNKFASINFSFTNKKTETNEFVFPKGETFIQSFSHQNNFYILVASKINNKLFLYNFDKDGDPIKHEINLNSNILFDKKNEPEKIITLLTNGKTISKFDKDTPNSIESVSDSKKMYLNDDNIVLTFDHNLDITQVLTININSKKLTKKNFKKPLQNIESGRKKTNSFIYENNIVVIGATKQVFSLHILNYNTGEKLKEYAVSKEEKIPFKNSPIIQKGGLYKNHRELEKTKKFLRKITAGKIGVSVIKRTGNYQFTIGGYVSQSSGMPLMMGGFGGIPIGAIGGGMLFFNPTMFAYNSYLNTKSTRIECLFNPKFEHIKNIEVTKNVFEKIKETSTKYKPAETIFKYKDYFIKGDYSTFSKKYSLTKFTN